MTKYDLDMHFLKISECFCGQRIDNFLRVYLKKVPKSMIYRIIRTGKVRVNQKKISFYYKLQIGDLLQIPAVQKVKINKVSTCSKKKVVILQKSIIYEDNHILVLNKPTGIAVHDGSNLKFNIIDGLRSILNSKIQFLELVHRLDRSTSGILLLAKNRIALKYLQNQWNLKVIKKEYLALVYGLWNKNITSISVPLLRKMIFYQNFQEIHTSNTEIKKFAVTYFKVIEFFNNFFTLLTIYPITGRTHQIRLHTQYANHPIIGDNIYGNYKINAQFKKLGFNRLFLHASKLSFVHPDTRNNICMRANIDKYFYNCLLYLRKFQYATKSLPDDCNKFKKN